MSVGFRNRYNLKFSRIVSNPSIHKMLGGDDGSLVVSKAVRKTFGFDGHNIIPKKESRASLRRPVVRQHTRGAGHERNADCGVGLPDMGNYSRICGEVKWDSFRLI
jgi:hypothetical protein